VSRRERKKSTRMTQPNAVMVGGETHAHRRGAGLSFARAQTCEQMTAHGYQPRTATPARDATWGTKPMQWRTETDAANTHTGSAKTHATARGGRLGGEQVRAAARSHHGVALR
jgi:hypothetical protein